MKDGVGIAKSLHAEAARFAQRATSEFFGRQYIAFVIDAGTAMEHLAKAVVADADPLRLFTKVDREGFDAAERRVICGGSEPPPTWNELLRVVGSIASKHTISADSAIRLASKTLPNAVNRGAAKRVSAARNAAVHAGEAPPLSEIDSVVADWFDVMTRLGVRRHPAQLWGNWAPVATLDHLRTTRSPNVDAEVRVRQAYDSRSGLAIDNARRGRINIEEAHLTVRCPACRGHAAITMETSSMVPDYLQSAATEDPVRILDCLYCGLTLYGNQIEVAGFA
jgi:hypothetical protein